MGCPCQNVTELLSKMGAEHAAMLKSAASDGHPPSMSAEDWLAHMEEEERLFFPLIGPTWQAQLARDHATFRNQLATVGKVDEAHAGRHATLEDWLVLHELRWHEKFLKGPGEETEPVG